MAVIHPKRTANQGPLLVTYQLSQKGLLVETFKGIECNLKNTREIGYNSEITKKHKLLYWTMLNIQNRTDHLMQALVGR